VGEIKVVVAGGGSAVILDKALLREMRGTFWQKIDPRFAVILLLSLILHSIILYRINMMKLQPVEMVVIEKIPERFARLIIEKPIPKEKPAETTADKATTKDDTEQKTEKPVPASPTEKKAVEQKAAKKAVAARAARVEKKMRTVGILGMLTGVGSTAKGPSVIDVLGNTNHKQEHFQDLEKALERMSGLQRTDNAEVLEKKLVRSKDVSLSHKENIDDLVVSVKEVTTKSFTKQGNFVIQRPESIEGAASSSTKRDNNAINAVVTSNKTSIRMSYEKYLKRIPELAGKITIRFTIAASGRVTAVQILENTTGNKELENDIMRKIKMWRFEEIPEGDVTVTYPFVFQPA
jgi:TonB family protein